MAVIDPNDDQAEADEGQLDYSAIDCPNCGCNDFKVEKRPTAGSWWGGGQALCNFCGHRFPLVIDREEGDAQPPMSMPGPRWGATEGWGRRK